MGLAAPRKRWLYAVPVILALLIWLGLMREFRLDDSFITYRYARNVARGLGLVYNPGEMVLSTTAPLYALLLAALSFLLPDFHVLGGLLGAVSIGLGGALIMALLPRRVGWGIRLWAGLAYALAAPLWLALGMETPLWIGLVLAAIGLVTRTVRARWGWAGLLIGLAVLTRPDAALPGALLGLWALYKSGAGRERLRPLFSYALSAAGPVLLFYGRAWAVYGSPIPATLSAKRAQAALGITGLGIGVDTLEGLRLVVDGLLAQSPLYALFGLLMAVGLGMLARRADDSDAPVLLAAAWGVLHLLAYAVMGVAPYRWYYAPLLPGAILPGACGLDGLDRALRHEGARLRRRSGTIRRGMVGGTAILLLAAQVTSFGWIAAWLDHGGPVGAMLPVVDWQAYRETGQWLHDHTPPEAAVGVAEVGQIGFYADRPMTDYLGLLQPDVAAALARRDVYSWLPAHAPDYLVFQRFRGRPPVIYNYTLADDPWFRASYREAAEFDDPRYAYGPVTVFERVLPLREMVARPVTADFGPLRLIGLATDGRDLAGDGEAVRVRLDWDVVGTPPPRLHVAVTAPDVPGSPTFDGIYEAANWAGRFSTWHTLVLPEGLPPGGIPLIVSAAPEGGGDYAARAVGWLDVSFPRGTASDPDAPTFSRHVVTWHHRSGAAQIRLTDSAVTVEDGRLLLRLTWFAADDLMTDYTLFVHLRPSGEAAPLVQADGQPLGGTYPTSLWNAGEVIPDTITLDGLPEEAGTYEVVIGWYTAPDGPRLTLDSGGDSLLLARVIVAADGRVRVAQ